MKIRKQQILLNVFLFIGLFQPNFLNDNLVCNVLYFLLISFSFVYAICNYIKFKKIPSIFTLLIATFLSLYCITTIINGNELLKVLYRAAIFISLVMNLEISNLKNTIYESLIAIFIILTCLLLTNLATYNILSLMGHDPFLGIRTRVSDYAFPLLVISCLLIYHFFNKENIWWTIFLVGILISLANIIFFKITTCIIGVVIALLSFAILKITKMQKFTKPQFWIILCLICSVLIIIFRVQNIFNDLISALTGKDATFTFRTDIWDASFPLLGENIFWGNGLINDGNFVLYDSILWQSHSTYIQVIYDIGILGLIVLLAIIFSACKNVNNTKTSNQICIASVVGLMFMMIVEILTYYCLFFLIFGLLKYIAETEKRQLILKNNEHYKKTTNINCEPLLSIIVPVYNVENYLDKCIKSIVNQTYKNLEIILVDDGSPDNCPQICDNWKELDSRIKVIHKENGGVSSARNAGLDICSGKYVAFVDSDDFIDQNLYSEMINKIENYNVDMIICAYYRIENNKSNIVQYLDIDQVINKKNLNDFNDIFSSKKCDMNCVWNKLYVKDKIVSTFNTSFKYGEDQLFNFDYFNNISSIYFLHQPLYNYVIHNSSCVHSSLVDNLELRKKLFPYQQEYCLNNNNPKLLSFFSGTIIKNFINNIFYKKLKYGKVTSKNYFVENLQNDIIKSALKNCKEKDFKTILSKTLIGLKSYHLVLLLSMINYKSKNKLRIKK